MNALVQTCNILLCNVSCASNNMTLGTCIVHSQVVLANVSTVAECGQMLLEAKVPEPFLVTVPVKLTTLEVRHCQSCQASVLCTFLQNCCSLLLPMITFEEGAQAIQIAYNTLQIASQKVLLSEY